MAEVIQFSPAKKTALEILEDIRKRVEDGETLEVAAVEVRREGIVSTVWSNDSRLGEFHGLVSGASLLTHRLLSCGDDPGEE